MLNLKPAPQAEAEHKKLGFFHMKIGCVFQSSVCASTISPIASDLGDPEMQLPLATRVRHSVSVLCSLLIPINCGKVSHGYSAQGQGTPIELVGWRVCENAAHQ